MALDNSNEAQKLIEFKDSVRVRSHCIIFYWFLHALLKSCNKETLEVFTLTWISFQWPHIVTCFDGCNREWNRHRSYGKNRDRDNCSNIKSEISGSVFLSQNTVMASYYFFKHMRAPLKASAVSSQLRLNWQFLQPYACTSKKVTLQSFLIVPFTSALQYVPPLHLGVRESMKLRVLVQSLLFLSNF